MICLSTAEPDAPVSKRARPVCGEGIGCPEALKAVASTLGIPISMSISGLPLGENALVMDGHAGGRA